MKISQKYLIICPVLVKQGSFRPGLVTPFFFWPDSFYRSRDDNPWAYGRYSVSFPVFSCQSSWKNSWWTSSSTNPVKIIVNRGDERSVVSFHNYTYRFGFEWYHVAIKVIQVIILIFVLNRITVIDFLALMTANVLLMVSWSMFSSKTDVR